LCYEFSFYLFLFFIIFILFNRSSCFFGIFLNLVYGALLVNNLFCCCICLGTVAAAVSGVSRMTDYCVHAVGTRQRKEKVSAIFLLFGIRVSWSI